MLSHPAPRVSIVVAAYIATPRQAELLDETLSTVSSQTCRDYECIVVDDGSPIDVRQIAAAHPQTITAQQENAGPAIARNTGVRASRGDYLVYLDADDHLLPGALEAGLAALEAHPDCGFVVGGREEMTYDGGPVPWGVPASPRETDLYKALLGFDWYIIPPSSVMFRREVVVAITAGQLDLGPWEQIFYGEFDGRR
ncbi:MAG TPA: glycosyltransferase, partial [Chthoniobacterales bacterium]